MKRGGGFQSFDTGPQRAAALNEMDDRVCAVEGKVKSILAKLGEPIEWPEGESTPGTDPGDLIVYLENGLV